MVPWPVFVKESDVAKIPQVWIFIVGLNNCPPATFKQIIPSPDPELHNGKELLLPAPVWHHGPRTRSDSPPVENIFTNQPGLNLCKLSLSAAIRQDI